MRKEKWELFDDEGTMKTGTKQECLNRLHEWLDSPTARSLYCPLERSACKKLTELKGDNKSLGFTLSKIGYDS